MQFKMIKDMMLKPQVVIPVKKTTLIKGKKVALLAITKENEDNYLWTLVETGPPKELIHNPHIDSYRETMKRCHHNGDFSFNSVTFGDIEMTFDTSSIEYLGHFISEASYHLNFFVIEELIPDTFDDELSFEYGLMKSKINSSHLPIHSIDTNTITIKTTLSSETHFIEKSFKMDFEHSQTINFTHPLTNESITVYLEPLTTIDVYKATEEKFMHEKYQGIPNLEKHKQEMIKSLEQNFPRDQHLIGLRYEVTDDISLHFYTVNHLDNIPKGSSSWAFIFSDNQVGSHGLRSQLVQLECVKELKGSIDVELFSVSITHPEEKYIIKG